VKATLLKALEEGVEPLTTIPRDAAWIVDAMAILQVTKTTTNMTYSELASAVFNGITRGTQPDGRIDWVVDAYPEISIKNVERDRRSAAASGSLTTKIRTGAQKVDQQLKKSLRSGAFKAALTQFLLQEWSSKKYASRLEKQALFVTAGDQCFRLKANDGMTEVIKAEVAGLRCTQEEADTRMLLNAAHTADHGAPGVVIKSPDSDVAVIALSVSHQIKTQLIFRTGTQHRTRYLDLTAIGQRLGQEVCSALPGYHAFSGCDSTSAFTGRGKVSGFKLLKEDELFRSTMAGIGQSFNMSADQLAKGEKAICSLYGEKPHTSVNDVRHRMFGTQTTDPCRLPPCQSAAHNHLRRANYQAAIWRMCLESCPDVPSPHGHGWIVPDSEVAIKWLDVSPAPTAVMECVSCKCQLCADKRCSCKKNGLNCNGACKCMSENCSNSKETGTDHLDSDDDSDDE